MAEGFANYLGKHILEAYSAGSKSSGQVNADAIKVMQEAGIDISSAKSKGFIQLPIKQFDYVIALGCRDMCPFVPAGKHIEWQIEDPKGRDMETFRKVRDDIKNKIKKLIEAISREEGR